MGFIPRMSLLECLRFQTGLLALLGFIPGERKNRATSLLGFCLATCILLGNWFCGVLQCAGFYYLFTINELAEGNTGHKVNPLIKAFTWTPFIFICGRAAIVLTIFFIKRPKWQRIVEMTDGLMNSFYGGDHDRNLVEFQKWKRLSKSLLIVSLFSHVGWEVLEWRNFMIGTGKADLWAKDALSPLPWDIALWEYLIIWTLCSTVPYLLSQVVFSVIILFGRFLSSCLCKIVTSIEVLEKALIENVVLGDFKRSHAVADELTRLHRLHFQVAEFGHFLSDTYGLILFVIYGLDVMTILGFVATVIVGTVKSIIGRIMLGYSILAFGMYATLFLFPLVQVHEQGHRINSALYSLTVTASHIMQTVQGYSLRIVSQAFLTATKDRVLGFHGAGIIHITRGFLAATFTLILSFAVVTNEFVDKATKTGCEMAGGVAAVHEETPFALRDLIANVTHHPDV
ncbi:hypothetical protein BV898_08005 [Hypsibius exemplaris]|uniref:Gustatory receptor n=1 Tax=Hypsibius exemplaris TaxID=2072580 RepID=A0A1W0WRQ2_HYPEX|nr:hypothetical protein BV898_08005 [Hypsibius exemplaris]